MTLEEKLELLKAYKEDKRVEVYEKASNMWYAKNCDVWDFDYGQYRIKPQANVRHKFEAGETIVWKREEGKSNPTFFLVEETTNEGYVLDKSEITDLETIEDEFISEKDVLWYFEWRTSKDLWIKDLVNRRLTIEGAREVVKNNSNLVEFCTMLSLGFRLRRDS